MGSPSQLSKDTGNTAATVSHSEPLSVSPSQLSKNNGSTATVSHSEPSSPAPQLSKNKGTAVSHSEPSSAKNNNDISITPSNSQLSSAVNTMSNNMLDKNNKEFTHIEEN